MTDFYGMPGYSGTNTAGNHTFYIYNTSTGTPLFGRWLAHTKQLQEKYYGKKFEDFDFAELKQWVLVNAYAAEDEIHEATDEISWKPWAKSEYFHRDEFIGECVDVLHFIGNLLVGVGATDNELNEAYNEKSNRNAKRQETGYTGLDKCTLCRRAIDDIVAHGGEVRETQDGFICNKCGWE